MPKFDGKVDDYINKSAEFARPVLQHLRALLHTTCPEVQETIKWSFPNFEYAGSILCSMASFKQHCTFGFWRASLLSDPDNVIKRVGEKTSMGSLGQIKSLADLPGDEILVKYIKEAMVLNERGVKVIKQRTPLPKEIETPDFFLDSLKERPSAMLAYEKFSPSQKKEYIEWLTEAKTEATRNKRLATAVEWIAEGKTRNWKYVNC